MGLEVEAITGALADHASRLGLFETVNAREVDNAPGNGLHASVWLDRVWPSQSSGQNSTTMWLSFTVRLETNAQAEPQDDVESGLARAVDLLMEAYHGDFNLGGLVRQIDLLGQAGSPGMGMRSGWLEYDAGRKARVMDVTVPMIRNDCFLQEAT